MSVGAGDARSGGNLHRREALAILAAVPLAAAMGTTPAAAEAAIAAARRASAARAAARATGADAPPQEPEFFTPHEWRTVRVLADLVIPADERSGSATDAGVPEFLDFMMLDRPSLQTRMRGGLRWLDSESVERFGAPFVQAAPARQTAILDDIAWPERAGEGMRHGVAFFEFFRDMTASGFFSSRMGVDDLGYEGNTWVTEWNGCPEDALRRLGVSYDLMEGP